jgi:hypothetical protein
VEEDEVAEEEDEVVVLHIQHVKIYNLSVNLLKVQKLHINGTKNQVKNVHQVNFENHVL